MVIATKHGNKKLSLLLVLRALELMSDEKHPVLQIDLSKMVNDVGRLLDVDIWCDRKTVGRHIKLLRAAGYDVIYLRGKGYYLAQHGFTKAENERLQTLILSSSIAEEQKNTLVEKLRKQQRHLDKKTVNKILSQESKIGGRKKWKKHY